MNGLGAGDDIDAAGLERLDGQSIFDIEVDLGARGGGADAAELEVFVFDVAGLDADAVAEALCEAALRL